jgi:hypothetical protein
MGLFSGITRAFTNPLNIIQFAMGPAGWASLAMRTIGSQIAMNLIQKFGQQMGLPQPMIDLAQAAFANASGQPGLMRQNISEAVRGFVSEQNLSPIEAGHLQRDLMRASDKSYNNLSEIMGGYKKKPAASEEEEETGGSWLVALARAMGKMMDKKAGQLQDMTDKLGRIADRPAASDANSKEARQEQKELMSTNAFIQAYAQELSILSNAFSQVAKTVGEAQVTAARK